MQNRAQTAVTEIALGEDFFQGALSVERVGRAFMPWRLPHTMRGLFPSTGERLLNFARIPSGVRIRIRTDAKALELVTAPTPAKILPGAPEPRKYDLVIDNAIVETITLQPGERTARFANLPGRMTICEIWMPVNEPVLCKSLRMNAGARCTPAPDTRRRWITYGSSITQCKRAHSPARIWAGTVARHFNLNLLNIGLGGECHLDPMFARVIRELPAVAITLKLGANTYYSSSMTQRTFAPAVIGFILSIRDRKPKTPILLSGPLAGAQHETHRWHPGGMTLAEFRAQARLAYDRIMKATGDKNLYYVDGLDILDQEELAIDSPDNIHPGPEGIDRQAENFIRHLPAGFRTVLANAKAH